MRAYRDQYAELFNEGRNVVLLGVSNDSPEELASWLKDEDFPFLFGSDAENDGASYRAFGGGLRENGMVDSRAVIVVGPDGRVAKVIPQFNQVDPAAYEELGAAIDAASESMPPGPPGLSRPREGGASIASTAPIKSWSGPVPA